MASYYGSVIDYCLWHHIMKDQSWTTVCGIRIWFSHRLLFVASDYGSAMDYCLCHQTMNDFET